MSLTDHIKIILLSCLLAACSASRSNRVPENIMKRVYKNVKTPFKYGLVLKSSDNVKIDCPSVFQDNGSWYMTYIKFDGRGYETWLAESDDLLHWKTKGRILSFSDTTDWDANQKAGYTALEDKVWGGSYALSEYKGKHWLSYIGGNDRGYEQGLLSIGIAYTNDDPSIAHEWQRLDHPVLKATDSNVRWWENSTLFKSNIIWDKDETLGYPFVMYYNARGDSVDPDHGAERIGMAISKDMKHWKRYRKNPVLDHNQGITGDPYIQKMGNIWIMFYYGAFWKNTEGAFNRFACSYDLIHWTDWSGNNLIEPSESYDAQFAHKSYVIKHNGIVYHYYCAVDNNGNRGIAVATSRDLGKSKLHFVKN